MRDITIAITAASYSGNKGAAAMLQSSIHQLYDKYGHRLNINLMSVYPSEDKKQLPFDFIQVVSAKPEQLLFIAFPLSVLYRLFKWCSPIRRLLEKNKIIKAYKETDVVLDEAGISFVDSRGFVMNTYAFVCAAVPLLIGTPVMKYSQAMGTFHSLPNRLLAKWILPKLKLICARGEGTLENLKQIGITENVKLCADGAFTMPDSPVHDAAVDSICSKDDFYNENVVALSLSSVVEKKCRKLSIPYMEVMTEFTDYLTKSGYHVLFIANAARINSEKPRNNDLMVCDAIYDKVKDKDKVRWYHKEMDAEEIRSFISKSRVLVASRFHAMIGALEKQVPVLLVGWSHKYQEVLDMFHLGQYAIDFSNLTCESLIKEFEAFMAQEQEIRKSIADNYDTVMESSLDNIRLACKVIDEVVEKKSEKPLKKLFDYNHPDKYLGRHIACRKGYAADEEIRKNAASGGMITALLCHLLKTGQIDGAFVTKSVIRNNKLSYEPMIATTEEQLKDCSSSIYMDMPLLKHLDLIRSFQGRTAVVLTPCLMRSLNAMMEKDALLKERIVLKLALYCSGNHTKDATYLSLEKSGISLKDAVRMYYRRGHWRGISSVLYKDGTEKTLSYTKTICAYKNAYFFEKGSCMLCQDHFGSGSDISFGDIWLKEMKSNPIKHTSCVIRNEKAYEMYRSAVDAGAIIDSHITDTKMVKSQKRALVFKFNCARAKSAYYAREGRSISIDADSKCKWNHKLAFYLARKNKELSENNYEKVRRLPTWFVYYYMCFIRTLLSF